MFYYARAKAQPPRGLCHRILKGYLESRSSLFAGGVFVSGFGLRGGILFPNQCVLYEIDNGSYPVFLPKYGDVQSPLLLCQY